MDHWETQGDGSGGRRGWVRDRAVSVPWMHKYIMFPFSSSPPPWARWYGGTGMPLLYDLRWGGEKVPDPSLSDPQILWQWDGGEDWGAEAGQSVLKNYNLTSIISTCSSFYLIGRTLSFARKDKTESLYFKIGLCHLFLCGVGDGVAHKQNKIWPQKPLYLYSKAIAISSSEQSW